MSSSVSSENTSEDENDMIKIFILLENDELYSCCSGQHNNKVDKDIVLVTRNLEKLKCKIKTIIENETDKKLKSKELNQILQDGEWTNINDNGCHCGKTLEIKTYFV